MTESEQVKKIVCNIALLSEYVMGMHKATSSSQRFQSILASRVLEQYDAIWETSPSEKITGQLGQPQPPTCKDPQMQKCIKAWLKVTGWRRHNFSKELSQLPVNACRDHSVQGAALRVKHLLHQQRQQREAAALQPSLDLCYGEGQAGFLTFWKPKFCLN